MNKVSATGGFPAARLSLGRILLLDAITCALMGVLLLVLTPLLAAPLGLPPSLLRWAGLLLLPCAALMLIAMRQQPHALALAWLVVLGNIGWVAASAVVVFVVADITLLGRAFVLAQAVVVLVLAWFEWRALDDLRASRPAASTSRY